MILSVIIPCFNSNKTLEKCLKAIRSSNYKNIEVIVINDGSTDNTKLIASKFVDKLINLPQNTGISNARLVGLKKAKGDLIVNIDSDVVINKNTLNIIVQFFKTNPHADAITGILSKVHPNKNFSSTYKNLYMHYYFSKLPDEVTFIYGSIFAIKKKAVIANKPKSKKADDTELGQKMFTHNKKIYLLKKLEVVHLKYFTLVSLVKNDMKIPFDWAQIFLQNHGWNQLFKNKTGFAHASKSQIISLFLISISLFILIIAPYISILLILIWLIVNFEFFIFLLTEKGKVFFIKSIIFTYFDHIIMVLGITFGIIFYFLSKLMCFKIKYI